MNGLAVYAAHAEHSRGRRHPGPFAREGEDAFPADAGGGPGHGDHGAAERERHFADSTGLPRPLLMKRPRMCRSGPGSAVRSSRQWKT